MTEYAILFLLLWRALRRHLSRELVVLAIAAIIALTYAVSDEWHQTFVPGRTGRLSDVAIDLTGILCAWLLVTWRLKKKALREEGLKRT